MFRLRRYRLALIFTGVCCLVVYHFTFLDSAETYFRSRPQKYQHEFEPVLHEFNHNEHSKITTVPLPLPEEVRPTFKVKPVPLSESTPQKPFIPIAIPTTAPKPSPTKPTSEAEDPLVGVDKPEIPKPAPPAKVHWRKEREHFPVPAQLIIKLPTSKASAIHKVQGTFSKESESNRLQRLDKRAAVKEAFEHSWKGYKDYAWGHDELAPQTRSSREKFGGWGATLVDALDTMWIMGLKKEFEEALDFVEQLDFTYSTGSQIPVFETTIRYLGGLLGAYDVSEHKYPVLLEKAKQLGDVLFGVFDTPNRMPILYYYWKPDQVAIPTQAASRSGLAEMGTLALEFTRLAQLTGNNSYFDAIQRVTDQLEAIQYNTSMPGMWPTAVDASGGCMPRPGPIGIREESSSWIGERQDPGVPEALQALDEQEKNQSKTINGEEHVEHVKHPDATITPAFTTSVKFKPPPRCTPAPVRPIPHAWDEYTLGAASDSFYEYLLKMHILLEGTTEQYAQLYRSSMKVAKSLFFRPMMPKEPDVLVSGTITVRAAANNAQTRRTDTGHLACFTGGMLALGAKALGLTDDLEIGRKLTDGCVTLYNIMPSGVMPEYLNLVPCKNATSCPWDEEEWLQALLPGVDLHPKLTEPTPAQEKMPGKDVPGKEGAGGDDDEEPEAQTLQEEQPKQVLKEAGVEHDETKKVDGFVPRHESHSQHQHAKRYAQRGPPPIDQHRTDEESTPTRKDEDSETNQEGQASETKQDDEDLPQMPKVVKLTPIERAWRKVKEQRLPPGVANVGDGRYILRPEAIESVYIMYRITGDTVWQDKGWKMFQSTVAIARTDVAFVEISGMKELHRNSELDIGYMTDSMESFWLAETLKYYYLLFSEPELISLDEWVFNTEAHPFKRSKK